MKKKNEKFFKNEIYLKRNRYQNPKENFKKLINILKKEKIKKNCSILDVGCSNGELIYNLKKYFKNTSITGLDVDSSLLRKAKKICTQDVIFLKADISKKNLNIGKFDIIICSGVLSIFSKIDVVLKNLLRQLNPGGKIYIFDSYNKYAFNLHIKSKYYGSKKETIFFKNVYSLEFLKKFFSKYKKKIKYFPFTLKINLKKNKRNPIYTWTETLSGKKIVTSGLGIIQYQFWVKIY